MKNKLISFDVTKALEKSVGDRVEGIDLNNSAAKEELRQAGIPMLSKALNESTDLGAIKSFFQSEAKRSELLSLGMIDVPGEKFRVMQGELTVGQFNEFREARKREGKPYEIIGDNADQLLALLNSGDYFLAFLTYVSRVDARAYIEWRNSQPGRSGKIRLMTEDEFILARDKVGVDKLSGRNWEWTSTPKGLSYILCCLNDDRRNLEYPESRSDVSAVRFVEDI